MLIIEVSSIWSCTNLCGSVCLEHQFNSGVVFGCYLTPMLLLNVAGSINVDWHVLAGFDSTFGISGNKFGLLGMNFNSLRRKDNPVCLDITKNFGGQTDVNLGKPV
jgi:hypothetical protein